MTRFHSKFFAQDILKQSSRNEIDKLSRALFDSSVDLNPHQLDAALFALRSPFSKGVILADEVGLGKTIEAGLVLCQLWAERKRQLLIICPASLRKQWASELEEKFNLPTAVLEAKTYKEAQAKGELNPFDSKQSVIICSYQFAAKMAKQLRMVRWHTVVLDEAHKLRNAHQESNKIGQALKLALTDTKKLLLTATPLQNSLVELYGLSSVIDENLFGDVDSFKAQYTQSRSDLVDLKERLSYFCKRTLRKQVCEYIRYTERKPMTEKYRFSPEEQQFYDRMSRFIQQEESYALPKQQRHLIALNLRKMLGSSTVAMLGSLQKIRQRLELMQTDATIHQQTLPFEDWFDDDDVLDADMREEASELQESMVHTSATPLDLRKLQQEIIEIKDLIALAQRITTDTRTTKLTTALNKGFKELEKVGAKRKVLIFTESRRTQDYLKTYLEANGYNNKIVLFNGSNSDSASKKIYEAWLETHRGSNKITGSKAVDMRAALVEAFKNEAEVMIATEAAAEGINLQFCSMIVNYDMPWNPQRIEQRIGRCHRYGQEHDVVVLNFLNTRNTVECRVFELLSEKFKLFEGVFGASDEVLGSVESGLDFEKKLSRIFETCRDSKTIKQEFDRLQQEMETAIQQRMKETQELLVQHFDEDVHQRLKLDATTQLNRSMTFFWRLSRYMLQPYAVFDEAAYRFQCHTSPVGTQRLTGKYALVRHGTPQETQELDHDFTQVYRLSHPLAEWVLTHASEAELPVQEVAFNVSQHPTKISVLEALKGKAGWLQLHKLTFETQARHEELLFVGCLDDGTPLDRETCEKLFQLEGREGNRVELPQAMQHTLAADYGVLQSATTQRIAEEHNTWFKEENARIDRWEDDMVKPLNDELENVKRQLKQVKRKMQLAENLTTQQQLSEEEMRLSKLKKRLRLALEEKEDDVERQVHTMRQNLKQRMTQKVINDTLFTLRWFVV